MSSAPFDEAHAHRRFAAEFNNAAWEFVEASSRSASETARMLDLAHAARCHWHAVGTPANDQRACVLLAFAYAVAGSGSMSLGFAQRCMEIEKSHPDLLTPFDRAAAATCLLAAIRNMGQSDEVRTSQERAHSLIRELSDPDERALLERWLTT
jgi:hypothetical protein